MWKVQFGLNPADVHVIGHSLGAQTAGNVYKIFPIILTLWVFDKFELIIK